MTSERKNEANRRNAQLSTGPRTPEGKARASRNALKHGLTAEDALLPGEDPACFEESLGAFEDEYQPASATDLALVHQLASCWWRLRRARRFEGNFIRIRLLKLQGHSNLDSIPPALHADFVATYDEQGRKTFAGLSLQESRVERLFFRTLAALEKRPLSPPPPAEATPRIEPERGPQDPEPPVPPDEAANVSERLPQSDHAETAVLCGCLPSHGVGCRSTGGTGPGRALGRVGSQRNARGPRPAPRRRAHVHRCRGPGRWAAGPPCSTSAAPRSWSRCWPPPSSTPSRGFRSARSSAHQYDPQGLPGVRAPETPHPPCATLVHFDYCQVAVSRVNWSGCVDLSPPARWLRPPPSARWILDFVERASPTIGTGPTGMRPSPTTP